MRYRAAKIELKKKWAQKNFKWVKYFFGCNLSFLCHILSLFSGISLSPILSDVLFECPLKNWYGVSRSKEITGRPALNRLKKTPSYQAFRVFSWNVILWNFFHHCNGGLKVNGYPCMYKTNDRLSETKPVFNIKYWTNEK